MAHTVEQLSIFLENKIGSLNEIMDILGKADIRIIAATVADTTDYGILRLITDDTQRAYEILKSANKSCNKSHVIVLSCGSTAGRFYDQLKCLSNEGVVIEYMYCFSIRETAFLIIRVNNDSAALSAIEKHDLKAITNNDLLAL